MPCIKGCRCLELNRECDSDLCGECGAKDVLDPRNRHRDLKDSCRNCDIQKNVPKWMLLGTSDVHGFGLFMGERVKRHDYIGEYIGELISKNEGERRMQYNDARDTEYMFSLNRSKSIPSKVDPLLTH